MPVKASVIQEPGRITIEEFPLPEIDEHSLLVRVDEVGVCGSDRHMYLGHSNLKWPVLPGHEIAGTIVEQGDAVDERMKIIGGPIQVGDRITVVPSSQQCGKC
ncbi:MAG: alcohol dehydrogenase catalytic domain-containing protein, partial [Planctomycetota bacterium]|nr:alcohol dehydrogenase catalytic domain-containing protein [Planctomycetota bacterium]